jgi:hypothetical protein
MLADPLSSYVSGATIVSSVAPLSKESHHEHGPSESDDHAYADKQGENDSGAVLGAHGPSVGTFLERDAGTLSRRVLVAAMSGFSQ